jgi:hypothetical protein
MASVTGVLEDLDVCKTHVYEEGLAHISEIDAKKLKQLETDLPLTDFPK